MHDHIKSVLELAEKLRCIGEEIKDNNLIAVLLCSLPNSYSAFITGIESKNEDELSLKYVQNKLIDEYTRRCESKLILNKNESTALKGFKDKPKYVNKTKYCDFCKKTNHNRDQCFKLKSQNPNKNSHHHFSNSKHTSQVNKQNNFACKGNKNNSLTPRSDRYEESSSPVVPKEGIPDETLNGRFNCVLKSEVNKNRKEENLFIIDSGASIHLSNSLPLFTNLKQSNKETITIANGTKLLAQGKGQCMFSIQTLNGDLRNITLDPVLYVPDLDSNLLSVQSCVDKGCMVTFDDDVCTIKKNNFLIADAKVDQGLYKLNVIPINNKAYVAPEILPACSNTNCILKWHQRLGHRCIDTIKKIQKDDLALGINVNNCTHSTECTVCVKAKLTEKPYPKQTHYRSTKPLDLIFSDVVGPTEVESLGSKRYFVTFIDDYSRYTQVYFISSKDEVFDKIKDFVASTTNKFRMKIKTLKTDNGTEYCSKNVREYLKDLGICHQTTTPYSPQSNGCAERKNRSLLEMCKAMLINAKLPKIFWAEAVATAAYLQNRLPSKATSVTPYELWNGHKPNLSHIRVFGCKAYVYVHKQKRKKFDEKAVEGTFLGYDLRSKGYRIYIGGKKVVVSRTVKFLENSFSNVQNEADFENRSSDLIQFNILEETEQRNEDTPLDEEVIEQNETAEDFVNDSDVNNFEDDSHNEVEQETKRISNRKTKGIPPERFSCKAESNLRNKDPETFKEILNLPNKEKEEWFQAMTEEMNSLKENDVYELTDLPKDKHLIGSKWVFKTKFDENGRKIKCKARLVAKGFTQKYKTDYDETFSPVVKHTTIRAFLTWAAYNRAKIFQVDVKTAFLHGKLNEELYMRQPEGFEDEQNRNKVCKLKKSIYGLKQSAKCWSEEMSNTLKSMGFTQSINDPCLYTSKRENGLIHLIVYVDDIIISSKDETEVHKVINDLQKCYPITLLGEAKYFLGVEIFRNEDGSFFLSQKSKINELVKYFNLEDGKPTYTPMETNYYNLTTEENLLPNNENFREAIGSLIYISSCTRPDITACTHILSRRCNNPRQKDWNAVKRVIRYLNTTRDLKLHISSKVFPKLSVYSDADWGQDPQDRKSTSGKVIFLGESCISWSSKKQLCVSLSSAEAEYVALSQATQDLLWLLKITDDLGLHQNLPIQVYEDNQSTIKLVESEKYNSRTKHIDTKYHHIRDLKNKDIIDIKYLSTEEMIGDIMTKPLPKAKFELCRNLMHLMPVQ